ncbi:hypothetical protein QFC21_001104 [Naganishia friedmannii]|uniref:Uncharacterized protein n=1 Tax=Naganishia friedmannii TaxID=89922 RepID=A0ACC2W8W2_9TREE|nr:hypothetical protein QFC21_001104 [Naganishia friedmannii]
MGVVVTDPDVQGLLGFVPKLSLAVIGLVLYAIPMVIFIANWFRYGRQRYMLALTLGSIFMILGWGCRVGWHFKPGSTSVYIPETLFILLSPCAFIANNYVILPRLATHLDEERCLFIKSRIIVRLFVWSDVITFIFQAAGGGMAAVGGSIASVGEKVRSIFRIAEYAQGYFGYLATHEGYFYCLDALPILLCIACFAFIWPPIVFDHLDEHQGYPMEVRTNSAISADGKYFA